MHEYDVTLKSILTRPGSALLNALTGTSSLRWLNVEAPQVNNRRVDLLGESPKGDLVHIELQARNEKDFSLRMGEYLFGIARRYKRIPRQVALYVGERPLRMKASVEGSGWTYRFRLVDIRDLNGDHLLASENLGDNILAVLTQIGNQRETVRRILSQIAAGSREERGKALAEFFIVAGLRKLSGEAKREARRMPILNDYFEDLKHDKVMMAMVREQSAVAVKESQVAARLAGLAEGRVKGRVQGRVEGQMELLLGLVGKRFGSVPPRVRKRLAALKPDQLTSASLRLLDARTIDELFAE